MRIGYDRLVSNRETIEEKRTVFLPREVDQTIIDPYVEGEVYAKPSQLTRVLATMGAGDTLVIHRLECVSETPSVWRTLLQELATDGIELEVLASPTLKIPQWLDVMTWWQAPVKKEKSRIISVDKESSRDAKRFSPWATDRQDRETYWQIFREIQRGASLRRTAKRMAVSQGTVLRIKRDVSKLRQTAWLIATFGITIVCLKIAQSYSSNWFLQVIICGVATVLMVYLSYSDIKDLDK